MKKTLTLAKLIFGINLICLLTLPAFGEDPKTKLSGQLENQIVTRTETPPTATKASVILPAKTNLYDLSNQETKLRSVDTEEIARQNQAVFNGLAIITPREVKSRRSTLTRQEAQSVLSAAGRDEIVGGYSNKYDPGRNIGFCFGRAMYVHLNLLARDVNKDSIAKVFLIGAMKAGSITWGFHVATMVRIETGEWMVLDPNFSRPMAVEEWFRHYQGYDSEKKLRIFAAEPNKFGASASKYNPRELANPFYNGYFRDMLGVYRENALLKVEPTYIARPQTCRSLF